jgi:hypothetical protein
MKKEDWLEIGTRLIGLWQITLGIDELVSFCNIFFKVYVPATAYPPYLYSTHALAHFLLGVFLILTAPKLVQALLPLPDADNQPTKAP